VRVGRVIEIVTPFQRRVFGGEHGIFVTIKNSIAVFARAIAAADEFGVSPLKRLQFCVESGLVQGGDFMNSRGE
jgi:hypothetical protein